MYLRISTRTNKDGSVASYVQLAHNTRDPKSGTPKAEILFNFGRREDVDLEALRRLVRSISRFLGPEDELKAATSAVDGEPVRFLESRPMGAASLVPGITISPSPGALGRKGRRFSRRSSANKTTP